LHLLFSQNCPKMQASREAGEPVSQDFV
jgi:hypothetical protein